MILPRFVCVCSIRRDTKLKLNLRSGESFSSGMNPHSEIQKLIGHTPKKLVHSGNDTSNRLEICIPETMAVVGFVARDPLAWMDRMHSYQDHQSNFLPSHLSPWDSLLMFSVGSMWGEFSLHRGRNRTKRIKYTLSSSFQVDKCPLYFVIIGFTFSCRFYLLPLFTTALYVTESHGEKLF